MSYLKFANRSVIIMENKTHYTQSTKKAFITVGVTILIAFGICVGVIMSHHLIGPSSSLSPSFQYFKEKLAKIDHAVQWKKYNTDNVSLEEAFVGGIGENQDPIYICRVVYASTVEILPGTYSPSDKGCRTTYGGKSTVSSTFEILTTKDPSALIWLKKQDVEVNNGAIVGGLSRHKPELWIARVDLHGKYQSLGKTRAGNEALYAYVPNGQNEYAEIKEYGVLCLKDFVL